MESPSYITKESLIIASPDQVSTAIPGEAVILDSRSGRYFGLKGVGVRVWQLLEQPRALGELVGSVVAEYDVEPEACERDLRSLLESLHRAGLVSIRDGQAP